MTRICDYIHCDAEFEPKRPHQRFHHESCRYAQWLIDGGESSEKRAQRVEEHPLAEARAEQESTELNKRLGLLIRQAIIDGCRTRREVHADDLEPLYAADMRERCRKLAPAQFGSLASSGLIEQVEYRKSSVPERKGSKSWSWRFTAKGWEKWGSPGADREQGQSGQLDSLGGSVCSGAPLSGAGGSSSGLKSASGTGRPTTADSEGQVSLLPEPSRMFDVDQRAA